VLAPRIGRLDNRAEPPMPPLPTTGEMPKGHDERIVAVSAVHVGPPARCRSPRSCRKPRDRREATLARRLRRTTTGACASCRPSS